MRYMCYIRFVVVLHILVLTIIFFLGSKSANKSEKVVYQEDYKRMKSLYQIIKYSELSTEEVQRVYMGTNQSQLDYSKNREPAEEIQRVYMGTNQSQLDYSKSREPTEEVQRVYMGTNQSQLDYSKNREPTAEVQRVYMGTNQSQLDYGKNREPYITFLLEVQARFCGDRFIVYKDLFSKLVNVIVDPSFGKGRKGGENLTQVMNQPEEEEFYQLEKGFFQMSCSDTVKYQFGEKSHLHKWLHSLDTLVKQKNDDAYEIPDWTIAVQRYEYVNMYHTMTDWYNVFLVSKVFKINPKDIMVLFIDGHPRGGLDSTWEQLFRNVVRIGHINKPVLYKNLIWGIAGYKSPLYEHELPEVAFIEDFREFFLSSHGVQLDEQINCDKLNVVIIWRHDYVAHPRNPSGSVSRKIKNENELLNKISDLFQGHNVHGLQIDQLPMKQQLEITSKTDILIGMHGAGLTHALFLPKHSGLIELFPIYLSDANIHFRAMSKWRHLYYLSWSNSDHTRELDNHYTVVDADHIVQLAREMRNMICENKTEVITQ